MFIPGITKRSSSATKLERRKGGGGGGRGGGGGGSRGGSSRGGSSGSSSSSSRGSGGSSGPKPRPITSSGFGFGGNSRSASAYGKGGGVASAIPAGAPFAGRLAGGGTRSQIFGTRTYGSGYGSGFTSRGVGGHPFPFFFWPVVWGGASTLIAGEAYLDARHEYGDVNNNTRPGGPQSTAVFRSPSVNSTFRLMADNATVVSLISDLSQNCSSKFSTNPAPASTPLDTNASVPRPEQVIQFYRASSIALTLDGYNNSATYAPEGTPDTPLPSNVDMALLTYLNETISLAAPLIDGGMVIWTPSYLSLVGLVWMLWTLMKFS